MKIIKNNIDNILIIIGFLFLLFGINHQITSCDGIDRFKAIYKLLANSGVSETPYSMIFPLFATPFYFISENIDQFNWFCGRLNVFILGAGVLIFNKLLISHLNKKTIKIFILLLILASMFPNHMRNFYGDTFTALTVGIGLMVIYLFKNKLFGWASIILGVCNTPASIIGFAFVLAKKTIENKKIKYLLIIVIPILMILLENWLRRGNFFTTNYENNQGIKTILPYSGLPGFSYPFFFGLMSILFSYGKGLIFFCPGILLIFNLNQLNLDVQLKNFLVGCFVFLLGLIVAYSKWWAWYGGYSWGPRFFLFASIPASFLIALCIEKFQKPIQITWLLLIIILSFWVGINGAIYNLNNLSICTENNYQNECLMWYTPEFSVLWRPFVVHTHLKWFNKFYIFYNVFVLLWIIKPLWTTILRTTIPAWITKPNNTFTKNS